MREYSFTARSKRTDASFLSTTAAIHLTPGMTREHSANNSMDTNTDTTTANQGAAVLVGSGPSFDTSL